MGTQRRVAVGAGLSLGAALGMTPTAEAVTFTVTNTTDANPGSLRAAIDAANTNANNPTVDQINFQSGLTGTIATNSALPTVTDPLEIVGPGASTLTVNAQSMSWRIIALGITDLTISGLTLSGGSATGVGGAITSTSSGNLTIQNSTLSGNTATVDGGAIYAAFGSTVAIKKSTLSGNTAGSLGSAIRLYNGPALSIEDSTISNNLGTNIPTVSIRQSPSPTIEGSTVAGNSGVGIFGFTTSNIPLDNTIVANNTGGDILAGGSPAPQFDLAFSLIEDPSGAVITQPGPNVLGMDPQLGALAFNNGPTRTQLPAGTSPAIDKGMDTGTDQRGLTRLADMPSIANAAGGNGADIGAVELQLPPSNPPVTPSTPAKKKKKCKKKKKKSSAAAAKKCKKAKK